MLVVDDEQMMRDLATEPPELYAVRRFVYGYLPKPFTQEHLAKTVARALEAARARPAEPKVFAQPRREPRRTVLLQWEKDGKLGLSFVDVSDQDRQRLEDLLVRS